MSVTTVGFEPEPSEFQAAAARTADYHSTEQNCCLRHSQSVLGGCCKPVETERLSNYKNSLPVSQKTHFISIIKTNLLKLSREKTAGCCSLRNTLSYCMLQCVVFIVTTLLWVGRDGVVGIVTARFGHRTLWGEIFRNRPDRPWDPPNLLYSGYWVSFPGG